VNKAPEFWQAKDKSGLRCISGKDIAGKCIQGLSGKPVDPSPIYASESFQWELWFHKSATGPALPQMRKFVESALPGYRKACGVRFPMEDVLRDCSYNADVAFLTAVWLYSSVLSDEVFPCGLRQWPPPIGGATPSELAAASSATASSSAISLASSASASSSMAPIASSYGSTASSSKKGSKDS
jgi:hypothetical protein